ncbi:uncharacterized protein TrAtP1_000496 [Trichoderma atroviride]|uniref:uncharacterized protein n=1 Tax=Hypocrea atroviridis TaxID=63577 RepID=UPI00332393DB|nr:hypothetical protein TrAtP1_000496 [Trichoderma atroviride]
MFQVASHDHLCKQDGYVPVLKGTRDRPTFLILFIESWRFESIKIKRQRAQTKCR